MNDRKDFIDYLTEMIQDRGRLAALRRGLGQPPANCPAMYPVIAPWLPSNCSYRDEQRHYLIASLFAFHPKDTQTGNMGSHLRRVCDQNTEEAISRRFVALLASHADDLPLYLRQTISYLKSKDTEINWRQLFKDLRSWDHPERFIQRHWANAFWGATYNPNPY